MINDRPIENYDGASHEREQRHWCGSIGCALAPRANVLIHYSSKPVEAEAALKEARQNGGKAEVVKSI